MLVLQDIFGRTMVWTFRKHFSTAYCLILVRTNLISAYCHLISSSDHDNAYVRAATARAFAEAVEPWPQSIGTVVKALEDFYREKVEECMILQGEC